MHDHEQEVRRGYNREVYLRVPADCLEYFWSIHPLVNVPRFDESRLYDDEQKNRDVWGSVHMGQFEERGLRKTARYQPKTVERINWASVKDCPPCG